MHRIILVPILLLATLPVGSNAASTADQKQKAILVTGASTGIGRKITERLAAHGYLVYAGARKETDLQALGAIPNVRAVRLDVTRPEDIVAAMEFVTKGGHGLYGLVNNAGIYTEAPLIDTSPEEFDLVMKVNVYGPYRVTKAFAPMIKASHGRIVNIGSISGILNETGSGAYQMSKHAMETFSATMARELAQTGVLVSIVEPGSYRSEIVRNTMTRSATLSQKDVDDWAKLTEPDDVAAAVEAVLSEPKPKLRYLVVPDAEQAQVTIKAQIEQLVQLNEGQPYTYDRAALVKLLDAALAGARPRLQQPASAPVARPMD